MLMELHVLSTCIVYIVARDKKIIILTVYYEMIYDSLSILQKSLSNQKRGII